MKPRREPLIRSKLFSKRQDTTRSHVICILVTHYGVSISQLISLFWPVLAYDENEE
jgi:hypothetical protein